MLTPEEQESLDTYNTVASQFARQKYTPDFWQEEFKIFSKYLPSGKVLDIGCGWGRDSLLFSKESYDYVGVDLSPKMVVVAKQLHPDRYFETMDFYNLNFPQNSFDGFWSAVSLIQAPQKNINLALSQVKKVVKQGGIGFFSGKKGSGEGFEVLENGLRRYFSYYDTEGMSGLLKENGFKILEAYEKLSPVEKNKTYVCCFCSL